MDFVTRIPHFVLAALTVPLAIACSATGGPDFGSSSGSGSGTGSGNGSGGGGGSDSTGQGGEGAGSGSGGGSASCKDPKVVCGGDCVDLTSDPDHCGVCDFSCDGATCANGACVVAIGQVSPAGIAVGPTDVYWTNEGTAPAYADGSVMRLPLSGGGTPVPVVQGQIGPRAIAVSGTAIVWANFVGGTIYRANLDGSGPTMLIQEGLRVYDIAVDSFNVYWAQWLGTSVRRMPINGGGASNMATGQNNAGAIAVNSSSSFWLRSSAGTVVRGQPNGSSGTVVAQQQNFPFDVATDEVEVFWTNQGINEGQGSIMKMPVAQSFPQPILSNLSYPAGIAIDATHVYFTTYGSAPDYVDGTVQRLSRDGSQMPEILAENQGKPLYIAIGPDAVYWTNSGTGEVMKAAK